jgi:hypothetical protein
MPLLHVPLLLFVLFAVPGQDAASKPDCRAWQECRQLALDAAGREDFERFHDLAWRAVQLGPKNDPALMTLLARAQSLSGRPNDAVVMIERLLGMGVVVDAATSEDFRRVRALPRWPDLEARLADGDTHLNAKSLKAEAPEIKAPPRVARDPPLTAPERSPSSIEAASKPTELAMPVSEPSAPSGKASGPPTAPPGPSKEAPLATPKPPRAAAGSAAISSALEPLRFSTAPFTPAGLAYDAVSRRFVVGNRDGRKLAVVDEFSQHVANLAGAQTSGFGEIAALEIDARRGDLWVVSSDGPTTALHKLQLISGRLLRAYPIPDDFSPVSFGDVAIDGDGTVLALDTRGHRLFRLPPRATAAEVAVTLPDTAPASIAPAEPGIVYIAMEPGIARVDVAARATTAVKTAKDVDLSGLTRIRWHRGALAGIQKSTDGSYRAVRITLDRRGRTATALEVLDPSISISNPTAATVVGNVLYYLANGEGSEMIVRRVVLR